MRKKGLAGLADILSFILGGALYSIGIMCFITPSQISPGGVTGISAMLSQVAFFTTGQWTLILNIPLVIIGFKKFGGRFIWKTALVTLINSVLLDVVKVFLPGYTGDRLLAAIFGGLFSGAGMAIVMLRGATTGGIDIAAKLLNAKYPHFSMGRLMLLIDAVIVVAAALFYRNAETAMYSVVAIFTSSAVMDSLLYGADKGKMVFIVTTHPKHMSDSIFKSAKRGVTVVDTVGGYTGRQRSMLITAARRQDVAAILSSVKSCDPAAFVIVAEAGEILGEGFEHRNR